MSVSYLNSLWIMEWTESHWTFQIYCKVIWNMTSMLVTFNGQADWLVYMIQLTTSICIFFDIVQSIHNRCHTPIALKLHQQNESEFAYRIGISPTLQNMNSQARNVVLGQARNAMIFLKKLNNGQWHHHLECAIVLIGYLFRGSDRTSSWHSFS